MCLVGEVAIRDWKDLLSALAHERPTASAEQRQMAVLQLAICRSLSRDVFQYVEGMEDPFDCFMALQRVYQPKNDVLAGNLYSEFFNYCVIGDAGVQDAYSTLRRILTRLAQIGPEERLSDTAFKRRLLDCLPARYAMTVAALKVSGTEHLSPEEVLGALANSEGEKDAPAQRTASKAQDYAQLARERPPRGRGRAS